jgi:spermidine synthase
MDLPDPNDASLSRLYAESTFSMALRRLADDGALVTQATSPYHAPNAFWCIARTLEEAAQGPVLRAVHPYHVHVPSFGEWGFVLVTPIATNVRTLQLPDDTRYLDMATLASMFQFPRDLQRREVDVNRLSNAALARYYTQGWRLYAE